MSIESTYEAAKAKFDKAQEEFSKRKQEFFAEAKISFNNLLIDLCKKYPEVEGFNWTQYTPYFNDGEECVFDVNEVYITKEDDPWYKPSDYTYENDGNNNWVRVSVPLTDLMQKELGLLNEARGLISTADTDMMRDIYGDHVQIFVTKSSVEVEEYEHE